VALSLVLLFGFSAAVPAVEAATSNGIITGQQISLHGPLVNKVDFTVNSADSTLYDSLASGTIQGAEWTFSTGSFSSAQSNTNLAAGTSLGYTFDGIGFNMLRPVTNTTGFRRAMSYLTDYSFIETTVLSGVGGLAQPDLYPCSAYASACNTSIPTYVYSPNSPTTALDNAVKELKLAGLTEGNTSDVALSSITWTYKGATWSPKFYYRNDDPLRSGIATDLVKNAAAIGLVINAQGIGGSSASTDIYAPSIAAAISPGVYNTTTGYNSAPQLNYSAATSTDTWDMYTFGWATSSDYDWAFDFLNSQNIGTSLNFENYYNQTMDKDTNAMNYAASLTAANAAAQHVDMDNAVNLPYLMSFYQNTLWADYVNGWTGYANVPAFGPNTNAGIYYTLLNVHPSNTIAGGTFNYAIHQAADAGGMNPLYNTNWEWQIDIWSEIYDTPLATPPAETNVTLAFMNWMTTSYSVANFTGSTQNSPGWFQMQGNQTSQKIDGEVITMNFDKNITWSDNVPLTAADYNFSLYAWGVSLPPSLPNLVTPETGVLSGPSGLIATYIPPDNPYQIQIYVNSTAVWNIASVVLPMLPQHLFKYFNLNGIATSTGAMDTTLPFASATASSACGNPCTYLGNTTIPTWIKYLPNLEIGSGPFWLSAYSSSTGAGVLSKNVNYFRSAWATTAATATVGSNYTLTEDINETIYNSGSSSMGGVPAGQVGQVPITNATGTVAVIAAGTNNTIATVPLTGGSNGAYTAAIPTATLKGGTYELVTNATYTFLGLARVWYQADGVTIPGGSTTGSSSSGSGSSATTTTTSSSSSSSTSSGTNYTGYILAAIVIVVIIIIAAVFVSRRNRSASAA
jgi:hypothetical protein